MNEISKKVVVVELVWIDCSDQMSREEVISLTYSSHLRVNVRISAYFVQVQVQLALERVQRVCKCNVFKQNIPRGHHSVEKEVCSRLVSWSNWKICNILLKFLNPLVYDFELTMFYLTSTDFFSCRRTCLNRYVTSSFSRPGIFAITNKVRRVKVLNKFDIFYTCAS